MSPLRVARLYVWSGLAFLAFGGALALVIRWQLAYPAHHIVTAGAYTTLFTTHGLTMIFFAVGPILLGAFGHVTIAEACGGQLAYPRLAPASFALFALSQVLMLAAFLCELPAGAGWTMYPPLSSAGMPGLGQTLTLVALLVNSVATLLAAANYVASLRRRGLADLSLAAWGQLLAAVLNLLFVPVLCAAGLLLASDRVAGTDFFTVHGDPILYQHLFWLFGHPEVYVLILPAWGLTADLLGTPFWKRGTVGAMIAVTVLSGLVYGHHLFQTGLGPLARTAFEGLTLAIGIPSTIIFANWLNTLARSRPKRTPQVLYAFGVVIVFALGGLSGLFLGAVATDVHLHDTMWVVGHFHLTMAAATLLAAFAAIHHWFPSLFGGRQLDARLAKLHFALTVPWMILVFGGLLVVGWEGQLRRLYDPTQYEFLSHLVRHNKAITHSALGLGAAQLIFVWNVVRTLRR